MYEFHGWASIFATAANVDVPSDTEECIYDQISAKIRELEWGVGVLDLRYMNAQPQIWTSGFFRHTAIGAYDPVEFFRFVAAVAPGSYGILYVNDTEDEHGHGNFFRVYVLARGKLEERGDPFLSPFQPAVEDAFEAR